MALLRSTRLLTVELSLKYIGPYKCSPHCQRISRIVQKILGNVDDTRLTMLSEPYFLNLRTTKNQIDRPAVGHGGLPRTTSTFVDDAASLCDPTRATSYDGYPMRDIL